MYAIIHCNLPPTAAYKQPQPSPSTTYKQFGNHLLYFLLAGNYLTLMEF